MNFILRIAPPFLRKLDTWLRINHSWIWTTRIHLHIYLTLLASLFFAAIGMIYLVDITEVPSSDDQDSFFGILFVPAIALYVYIIYNMSLFNTDKSAGKRFRYQEFFLFIIWFITFCLPLLIPYPAAIVLNSRIDRLTEDRELQMDMNAFNLSAPFVNRHNASQFRYYPSDSIYMLEFPEVLPLNQYDEDNYTGSTRYNQLQYWAKMCDSIFWHQGVFEKERPRLYYCAFRYFNDYIQYDRLQYDLETNAGLNDSLYRKYLRKVNLARDNSLARKGIGMFTTLVNKYTKQEIDPQQALNDYTTNQYYYDHYRSNRSLCFNQVERNISHITAAKQKYVSCWNHETFYGLLLMAFSMTVLFSVFKSVHWKQFILCIALYAILFTLLGVAELTFRLHGNFILFCGFVLPLLFLIISAWGFSRRRFHWTFNQVAAMLALALPFYPLMALGYLDEIHNIFHISYFDRYKIYIATANGEQIWEYTHEYYELVRNIWSFAFWSGILSYVFIWNTYLKTLFLRFWSLPKPN